MRRICAKTIHPCIVLAASFGTAETSLLIITSGIHAAAENSPQRIISAMDGGGSRQ